MGGTYTFGVDRTRGLLTIAFAGFFQPGDLAGYEADKGEALKRLGCAPNAHATLCDFSACGPQSAEVLAIFARSLADPGNASRRIAVVVGAALARMQVNRVLTRAGAGCFTSRAEAERWLRAEGGSAPSEG